MTRVAKIFLIGALFLTAVFVLPSLHHGYDLSDTALCLITTGHHATRFGTGYTDRAFAQIRPGMTTNEVLRVLGEPVDRTTRTNPPEGMWFYSEPASTSGHYHLRAIGLASDGRVSAVHKSFYFD